MPFAGRNQLMTKKKLFQPANAIWSTCSLVEIQNTLPFPAMKSLLVGMTDHLKKSKSETQFCEDAPGVG